MAAQSLTVTAWILGSGPEDDESYGGIALVADLGDLQRGLNLRHQFRRNPSMHFVEREEPSSSSRKPEGLSGAYWKNNVERGPVLIPAHISASGPLYGTRPRQPNRSRLSLRSAGMTRWGARTAEAGITSKNRVDDEGGGFAGHGSILECVR